jgi:hypothetical protein
MLDLDCPNIIMFERSSCTMFVGVVGRAFLAANADMIDGEEYPHGIA